MPILARPNVLTVPLEYTATLLYLSIAIVNTYGYGLPEAIKVCENAYLAKHFLTINLKVL